MQSRRVVAIIAIVFMLAGGCFDAWSQQSEPGRPQGPSPGGLQGLPTGRPQGPPPAGAMCTDGQNLYVLQGPWIYQFSAADLSLKKKIELPRPEPPAGQGQPGQTR